MSPRHHFKQMIGPYFDTDHYQETHEAKVEREIAEKWYNLKHYIKGAFKRVWTWNKKQSK